MVEYAVRLAGPNPRTPRRTSRSSRISSVRSGSGTCPPEGWSAVVDALVTRLDERGVDLVLGAEVTALLVDGGRVVGVGLDDGSERRADVVVTDVDPRTVFGRWLPAELDLPGRRVFETATPAIPVAVTHLGLAGDVPAMPGGGGAAR